MTTSAAAIRIGVLESDAWKAWALPWKLVASDSRLAELLLDLLDGGNRLPDRNSRREVERDRHRRELALMIDHERRHLDRAGDQGPQRHLLASR